MWPRAETRCCARHVYCNFRQVFGGDLQYRRAFWKVAKSTTENEFEANMKLFANISVCTKGFEEDKPQEMGKCFLHNHTPL